MTTYTKHLKQAAGYALAASITILLIQFAAFFAAEPSISYGQADATSTPFTINQTITSENSFKTISNVTMAGDINGVTGGNATGTADFVVLSNNPAGYTVEIQFDDNGAGNEAMKGMTTDTYEIRDYDNSGEPTLGFSASSAAQFAYTVTSVVPGDTDLSFSDDGGGCNASGSYNGNCWKEPTVAGFTIVDASDSATNGATSTIQFKVHVPSGANPTPQAQVYTATATLTMFLK